MSKKRIRAVVITGAFAPADMGPQYVLPATADAYEQMVEQGAIALNTKSSLGQSWLGLRECSRKYFRDESSVVLRAIGITPPKKGQP